MEKKTKLKISGIAKKSIQNIEKAKNQGKNSVVIEKNSNNFSNKSGSYRSNFNKSKTSSTFQRGFTNKSNFTSKISPITSDFEKRKLAEQRATKRLKEENQAKDKKTLKPSTKTVSYTHIRAHET